MRFLLFKRSAVDPCLYWKDGKKGLTMWLSWVDDCLCIGQDNDVKREKSKLMELFDCEDLGEFKEYVQCKIEHNKEKATLKFTQPVLLQSYEDEFELPNFKYESPAEPGKVLAKVLEGQELHNQDQYKYRSGVGKLLHMMRWSRPEI